METPAAEIQDAVPLHLEYQQKHLCGVLREGDGFGIGNSEENTGWKPMLL
jgi:hypothetical protein